jgi:TPR repeat protein
MDYISFLPKSQKEKAFTLYSKAASKGLKDANWMIAMLVFQVLSSFMDRKLAIVHAEKASKKT